MAVTKPEVSEFAKVIKERLVYDADNAGNFTPDSPVFNDNLTDGLTPEVVAKFNNYENLFTCASALAFGELSTEKMLEDKELNQTTMTIPMGKNKLELSFRREQEVSDGKGGRQMKKGCISVKYRHRASLTPIKAELSSKAAELLK